MKFYTIMSLTSTSLLRSAKSHSAPYHGPCRSLWQQQWPFHHSTAFRQSQPTCSCWNDSTCRERSPVNFFLMAAAVTIWRQASVAFPVSWSPLILLFLGSVLLLTFTSVGVQEQCCGSLQGLALLRCQLWGGNTHTPSTSKGLTVTFSTSDLLPFKKKPSQGKH